MTAPTSPIRVSPWQVGLALGLVYTSWGTTYLATGHGVKPMPPGLFSGLLVIGSALAWALGAFMQRRRRVAASLLASAAWQMVLGGGSLALVGCCCGETQSLTAESFTPGAVAAFFYLLVVGSLIGFVA